MITLDPPPHDGWRTIDEILGIAERAFAGGYTVRGNLWASVAAERLAVSAAIQELQEQLNDAGLVIVPREATRAMVSAAALAIADKSATYGRITNTHAASVAYRAMIDKAEG